MLSMVEVVTEPKDIALISLRDAKLGLNMVVTTSDDQIELMIKWASAEVAQMCNRVLAEQTVIETVLELEGSRIFLSQWPIKKVTEVNENGTILTSGTDYNLDTNSGIMRRAGGALWAVPTTIKYTGGYDLPQKAPPDLASAVLLVTREAFNAAKRGDSTIRMITHKQSRIMYFDPNAAAVKSAGSGGAGGSAAKRAISDLVKKYIRYVV